jgi:cytoskeletal protein CcmA (bactofilin family)
MTIKGSIQSAGEMQIDGSIEGDVTASSLTIGQTGEITGEVRAASVTVRGKVVGSIRARKVELETGSRVEGDILHASLSIQSNAVFEGQVKHADDPLKSSTLPTPNSVASNKAMETVASAKSLENGEAKPTGSVPVKTGFGPSS